MVKEKNLDLRTTSTESDASSSLLQPGLSGASIQTGPIQTTPMQNPSQVPSQTLYTLPSGITQISGIPGNLHSANTQVQVVHAGSTITNQLQKQMSGAQPQQYVQLGNPLGQPGSRVQYVNLSGPNVRVINQVNPIGGINQVSSLNPTTYHIAPSQRRNSVPGAPNNQQTIILQNTQISRQNSMTSSQNPSVSQCGVPTISQMPVPTISCSPVPHSLSQTPVPQNTLIQNQHSQNVGQNYQNINTSQITPVSQQPTIQSQQSAPPQLQMVSPHGGHPNSQGHGVPISSHAMSNHSISNHAISSHAQQKVQPHNLNSKLANYFLELKTTFLEKQKDDNMKELEIQQLLPFENSESEESFGTDGERTVHVTLTKIVDMAKSAKRVRKKRAPSSRNVSSSQMQHVQLQNGQLQNGQLQNGQMYSGQIQTGQMIGQNGQIQTMKNGLKSVQTNQIQNKNIHKIQNVQGMTGVHGLSNVQISQNIQSLPNKHIRNLSGQEMQNIKNISNISNHNIHLQTSIQTSHQTPQTVPNTIRPQINDNHLQTHELSLNFENSTSHQISSSPSHEKAKYKPIDDRYLGDPIADDHQQWNKQVKELIFSENGSIPDFKKYKGCETSAKIMHALKHTDILESWESSQHQEISDTLLELVTEENEIAERREALIIDRIKTLQFCGTWTDSLLPKCVAPQRQLFHTDKLIGSALCASRKFMSNRSWRIKAAKRLAEECSAVVKSRKAKKELKKRRDEELGKFVCKKIARMIENFWRDQLKMHHVDLEWSGAFLDEISDDSNSMKNSDILRFPEDGIKHAILPVLCWPERECLKEKVDFDVNLVNLLQCVDYVKNEIRTVECCVNKFEGWKWRKKGDHSILSSNSSPKSASKLLHFETEIQGLALLNCFEHQHFNLLTNQPDIHSESKFKIPCLKKLMKYRAEKVIRELASSTNFSTKMNRLVEQIIQERLFLQKRIVVVTKSYILANRLTRYGGINCLNRRKSVIIQLTEYFKRTPGRQLLVLPLEAAQRKKQLIDVDCVACIGIDAEDTKFLSDKPWRRLERLILLDNDVVLGVKIENEIDSTERPQTCIDTKTGTPGLSNGENKSKVEKSQNDSGWTTLDEEGGSDIDYNFLPPSPNFESLRKSRYEFTKLADLDQVEDHNTSSVTIDDNLDTAFQFSTCKSTKMVEFLSYENRPELFSIVNDDFNLSDDDGFDSDGFEILKELQHESLYGEIMTENELPDIYCPPLKLVKKKPKPKPKEAQKTTQPNTQIVSANGQIMNNGGQVIGSRSQMIGANGQIIQNGQIGPIGQSGQIIGQNGQIIGQNGQLIRANGGGQIAQIGPNGQIIATSQIVSANQIKGTESETSKQQMFYQNPPPVTMMYKTVGPNGQIMFTPVGPGNVIQQIPNIAPPRYPGTSNNPNGQNRPLMRPVKAKSGGKNKTLIDKNKSQKRPRPDSESTCKGGGEEDLEGKLLKGSSVQVISGNSGY